MVKADEIDTLFKVEGPFKEVKNGYGYIGVVLKNSVTHQLQCHICGKWVNHLPSHAWNSHKTKNLDYRKKFQLPLSAPLVSKTISEKISKNCIETNSFNRFGVSWKKQAYLKGKKKKYNNAKYARNNESFQNKHGLCELQIHERYVLVAEAIGKEPSERDILEIDSKLAWAIRQRFGSINKFKRKYGFSTYSFTTRGKIIKNKNKITGPNKLGFLSQEEKQNLINKYGSLRRAVATLGKDWKNNE